MGGELPLWWFGVGIIRQAFQEGGGDPIKATALYFTGDYVTLRKKTSEKNYF